MWNLNDEAKYPEEVRAALLRIQKGLKPTILLTLAVLLAGVVLLISTLSNGFCEYNHRIGTVLDDGTARYVQEEYQYISLADLGLDPNTFAPGMEVELCFHTATDELIQACPNSMTDNTQNSMLTISLVLIFGIGIAIPIGYILFCMFTPFGSAYYQYRKALREAENEQIPLRVRLIIGAIALALTLFLFSPWISEIIYNIQRDQRIHDRADLIQDAEDAADQISDAMDKVNDAVNTLPTNDGVADASDAAGNIWDILSDLNSEQEETAP